ncbi:uncharacterized protein [Antedon mediterranea]|uniref:uncharacterized protein n=1 Tax=Antedon mediterranea TaxID=105859 RepID=UPI003AF6F5A1
MYANQWNWNDQSCADILSFVCEIFDDSDSPTFTYCPPDQTVPTDPNENFATLSWVEPTVDEDNQCAISIVSNYDIGDQVALTSGLTTTITNTYIATDPSGNTGTCTFSVTVKDDEKPDFTACPDDITDTTDPGSADAVITWGAVEAIDNSGVAPTIDSNYENGTSFPIGSTLVMYNATDMYGNTNDSCSFRVDITDNEAPLFTSCTVDITSETDPGSSTSVETWDSVTATDNSNEQPTILSNYDSGFAFPIGVTTVEYNATDAAGNVNGTCSFNITIMDMEPPEFTSCPSDITNETNPGLPTAIVTWPNVTAVDNSLLTVMIDGSHKSGATFPIGTTDVMFNATDPAGNVNTTCNFSVTIKDTEPPVFTECPSDIIIRTDPDLSSAVVNWTTVEATDNSGDPPTILSNFDGGDTFPIGSTLVKYNATDMGENVNTTCQFFVNVTDDQTPVFTFCPSDNTSTTDQGINSTTMEWMSAEATDNSNETPMYMRNHNSGDTFEFGDTTVQINASDAAGNVNYTCVFVITITDDEIPMTDDCPNDQMVTTDSGDDVATGVTWTSPTFTDNVDSTMDLSISESQTSNAATEFSIGATMITINATDLSINKGMCSFNIYVTDEEAPVFTMCPDDQSVNTTEGEPTGLATWMEPTATDNSEAIPDIVGSHNQTTFEFPAGETVVQYTASDPYDNVNTTCTFTITVEDNEAPIITLCPSDVVDYTDTTTDSTSVMWSPTTTATDNSGVDPNITTSIQQGATLSIRNHTVYVNATDGSGNVNTTCSFNIEIIDNVVPDLTCPNNTLVMLRNGSSTAFVNWTKAEVSDNSGLAVTLSSSPKMSGDEFNIGTFVIIYTAIDVYGNVATCTFAVTVRDLKSPYFENCTESFTIGTDPGLATAVVSWVEPVAMDNNGVNRTVQNYYPNQIYNISEFTVVYVAYDDSNNNATCEFVITVEDQENPNITCPDNITAETAPGLGSGSPDWTVPVPTDNVELMPTSPVAIPDVTPPVNIAVTGSTPFEQTYIAEDTAGNTASCTFYIIVEDKEHPVINDCPPDQNLTTSSGVNYTAAIWTEPTATDNAGTPTLVSTHNSGSDFYIGETLVTYTAEDSYGNTEICNFTVNLIDDEPPTFNCPASFNVNTSMNANSTNVTWQYPTFMDNSYEMVAVTESHTIPTVFEIGVHEVTYSFEDIYSNEDSCSFNISINDFEDPEVLFCPDDIHNNTEPGLSYANITWLPPVAEDNSGFFTTVQTATSGDGFGVGVETVTFTFTDANMNMNECMFIVNITDTEKPVITCPRDLTVGADAGQLDTSVKWSSPTTSDNSNGNVDLAVDYMNGSTFSIGTTVVSYQATDPSGNMESCTFNITVEDTEAPIVSDCPEDFILPTDDGEPDRETYWTEPTAMDNSGSVFVSQSHTNGSTFDLDNTTVTYNFTDPSGNLASCEFIVTIIDIEAPVPSSCPSNSTYSTDMGVSTKVNVAWTQPAFNDNVPGTIPIYNNIFPNTYTFQLGTTEVEYYATDAAMNTGYCSFFITVIDTEDPVVTCPSNITANSTEGAATAIVNYTATVTDNVNVTSQSFDIPSGSMFNFGDTAVTFTASDAAGNEANCTFVVTIEDMEPPEFINCPGELNGTTDATVNYTTITWDMLVAIDNSLVTPTIASSHNPNDEFYIGTVTVTATATDGAGNEATCTFDVLVIDDEVPSIMNCPADVTQMVDMGTNASNVNWTEPTATDNSYEEPMMTSSHSPNDVFEFGMATVEYNFTDGSGNLGQCIFTVTISDDEPPEFQNCPNDIEDTTDFDENTSEQSWTAPTPTDNNGVPDVSSSHTSPFMFAIGVTNVTYLATDSSGNTVVCYFLVNITDQQNPNVTCPTIASMDTATGDDTVSVMWSTPTNSDNDGVADVTSSPPSGTAFEIGDTNVMVTVTDNSGNIEMCTFTVTITDPEDPVISNCPDNITQTTDLNQNYTSVTWTEPTATDNDGTPMQSSYFSPGDNFEIGEHTVVYTFTDPSGNEATCTFYINITDDQPPVTMDCPSDITNTTDDMDNIANGITWTPPTYTDNSNQPVTVVISGSSDPPASFPVGINNVMYTATDESGNVDVCTFQVEITDNDEPMLTCPDNIDVALTDPGQAYSTVSWNVSVSDNSGNVTWTCSRESGDQFDVIWPVTRQNVTCEATDVYGNTAECTFYVKVFDEEQPVLSCPSDIDVFTTNGSNKAMVSWSVSITDNSPEMYDVTLTGSGTNYDSSGQEFYVGTTTLEYVAEDIFGNSANCSFTVNVLDDDEPMLECPDNIDVALTDPGQAYSTISWNVSVSDNSGNVTWTCSRKSGDQFDAIWPVTRQNVTCEATDVYGNMAECTFYVIVIDKEQPVLSCPNDIDVFTTNGSNKAMVSWSVSITDNSPEMYDVTLTGSGTNYDSSGQEFYVGTTTLEYVAEDIFGNSANCSFTVNVLDDDEPMFTCPDNIDVALTDPGQAYSTVSWNVSVSDNSGNVTWTCSRESGEEFDVIWPVTRQNVTCEATDVYGNMAECTFYVIVIDKEQPVVSCPSDIDVFTTNGSNKAMVSWSVRITDNSPEMYDVTLTGSGTNYDSSGQEFYVGTTTLEYVAEDIFGNSANCSFTVNVLDDDEPMLECPDNIDVALTDPGQAYSTISWNVSVSDNSGNVTWTCSRASGDQFDAIWPVTRQNVTCEATDVYGNMAECTFYVIVIDKEQPVVSCPSDVDVFTSNGSNKAMVSWSVSITDNSPAMYDVIVTGSGTNYDSSGQEFYVGTTTIEYVAEDIFGNSANCSFTVNVTDDDEPMLTCPDNIDIALTDPGQAYSTVSWNVSVSDNSGNVTWTCSRDSGDQFDVIWPVTRQNLTCEATDVYGNMAECTFYVIVIDKEQPVVSCPSDIDVFTTNGSNKAMVSWSVSITDNSPAMYDVIVTGSGTNYDSSGQEFYVGTTTLEYVAEDIFGNSANCSFTVNVADDDEPMLTCPDNIDIALTDPGQAYSTVSWNVSVSDNSGNVTWTCSRDSGDQFDVIWPVTRQNVTCEATDVYGNMAECTFYVIVIDKEQPVVSCPSDIDVFTTNGSNKAMVSWSVSITDNSPAMYDVIVTGSGTNYDSSKQEFYVGTTTLEYFAEDIFGNSANCSFTVKVADDDEPMLTCPDNIDVALTDPGQEYSTVSWNVSVSDNSGNVTWTCSRESGEEFDVIWPVTRQNVTCEATDVYGNMAECTFYVIVIDKEQPVVSCPSDIDVFTTNGSNKAMVSWSVTITDNSPEIYDVIVTGSGTNYDSSGQEFYVGTTTIEYIAEDIFGNSANCSFTVNVADDDEPMLTCPDNIDVALTDPGQAYSTISWNVSVSDNSGNVTWICSRESGDQFDVIWPVTRQNVTCEATDVYGNMAECTFYVIVIDEENPVFSCPNDIDVFTTNGSNKAMVSWSVSITDNSPEMYDVIVTGSGTNYDSSGQEFYVGTTTIEYFAEDIFGNSANCSFTVNVADDDEPMLTCPDNIDVALTDLGQAYSTISWNVSVSDNSGNVTWTCSRESGDQFEAIWPVTRQNVTCEATDVYGNMAECTFYIKVFDEENPSIFCPDNIDIFADDGSAFALVSSWSFNFTDNTEDLSVSGSGTQYNQSGQIFFIGVTTLEYVVTDVFGNMDKCSFNVIVKDDQDPIFQTCPVSIVEETDLMLSTTQVTWETPVIEDNSGQATLVASENPGSSFEIGTSIVIYTASDNSSNTAECTFNVTVEDKESPVLDCPGEIIVVATSPSGINVTWEDPEYTDNSGETVLLSSTEISGNVFTVGQYIVTYTGVDQSGNNATCQFEITVGDSCTSNPCMNGGTCAQLESEFVCKCPILYEGDICEIEPGRPTAEIQPLALREDLQSTATFHCNITYSVDWRWYKDDNELPSETQSLEYLTIELSLDNQGYYYCKAFGVSPHEAETAMSEEAILIAADAYTVPVVMSFLTLTYNSALADTMSEEFKNTSTLIASLLTNGLSTLSDIFVQVRKLSSGSVIADVNIYTPSGDISYTEFSEGLFNELTLLAETEGFIDADSIAVFSTERCSGGMIGDVTFEPADVGQTVASREFCPQSTVNYDKMQANCTCYSDGLSAATCQVEYQNCGRDATADELLERLNEVEVTEDNAEEVITAVNNITSGSDNITSDGLTTTADIIESIVAVNSTSPQVTSTLVDTVASLFEIEDDVLLESQMESNAPSRIIESLEEQLAIVDLENDKYEMVTSNVAVQAQILNMDELDLGFGFASFQSSDNNEITDVTEFSEQLDNLASVSIYIPPGVSSMITTSSGSDEFRVITVVYNDSSLFPTTQFDTETRRPNGQVISLSIPGVELNNLPEPITTTFIPSEISMNNNETTCVFWDFKLYGDVGGWSSDGCYLANGSMDGSDRQVCQCDHLTNFAVLMNFYSDTIVENEIAEYITYIGLGISIACLIATIFTFTSNRKLRKSKPQQILCHLCVSLLCLYIIFLVGIDKNDKEGSCIAIAGLIHYFLLTSIFWMTVQAINMYYSFVKVLDTHVSRFFLKACLFGWGIPVVIVVVTIAIDVDNYANTDNYCFLVLTRMYYSVAIPIAILLIFNVVIFVMVLYSLSKLGKVSKQAHQTQKKNKGMQLLQNAVCISVVMGMTWLIGFFAIGTASTMIQILFCILNSLQGFFIFVMYCLRSRDVRKYWKRQYRQWTGQTRRRFKSLSSTFRGTRSSTWYSSDRRNSSFAASKKVSDFSSTSHGNGTVTNTNTDLRRHSSNNNQVSFGKTPNGLSFSK